jgi:hypothetical protein
MMPGYIKTLYILLLKYQGKLYPIQKKGNVYHFGLDVVSRNECYWVRLTPDRISIGPWSK